MSDMMDACSRAREIFSAINSKDEDSIKVADLSTYLETVAPSMSLLERRALIEFLDGDRSGDISLQELEISFQSNPEVMDQIFFQPVIPEDSPPGTPSDDGEHISETWVDAAPSNDEQGLEDIHSAEDLAAVQAIPPMKLRSLKDLFDGGSGSDGHMGPHELCRVLQDDQLGGHLSREMKGAFATCSERFVENMMKHLDRNHDGKFDWVEFALAFSPIISDDGHYVPEIGVSGSQLYALSEEYKLLEEEGRVKEAFFKEQIARMTHEMQSVRQLQSEGETRELHSEEELRDLDRRLSEMHMQRDKYQASAADLEKELDAAHCRISDLEAKLASGPRRGQQASGDAGAEAGSERELRAKAESECLALGTALLERDEDIALLKAEVNRLEASLQASTSSADSQDELQNLQEEIRKQNLLIQGMQIELTKILSVKDSLQGRRQESPEGNRSPTEDENDIALIFKDLLDLDQQSHGLSQDIDTVVSKVLQDGERIRTLEAAAREHDKLHRTHDALVLEKEQLETALDKATEENIQLQELLRAADAARQQLLAQDLASAATADADSSTVASDKSELAAAKEDFDAEAQAIAAELDRLEAVDDEIARLKQQVAGQQTVLDAVHRVVAPKNPAGDPISLRDAMSTAGSLPFVPPGSAGGGDTTQPTARQVHFPIDELQPTREAHVSPLPPSANAAPQASLTDGGTGLVQRVIALADGYNTARAELRKVRDGMQEADDVDGREHVARLQAHNRQLQDDIDRLQNVEHDLQDARARHEALQDKLRISNMDCDQTKEERKAIADKLERSIRAFERDKDRMSQDMENLSEKATDLEHQLDISTTTFEKRIADLEATVESLKAELSAAESKLAAVRSEREGSITSSQDKLRDVEQRLQRKEDEVDALRQQLASIDRKLTLAENEKKRLKEALHQHSAKQDSATRRELDMTKQDNKALQADCHRMQQQYVALQGKVEQLTRELRSTQAKLRSLRNEQATGSGSIASLNQTIRELEDNVTWLTSALDESEQHRSALVAQLATSQPPARRTAQDAPAVEAPHPPADSQDVTNLIAAEIAKMNSDLENLATAERLILQLRAELERLRAEHKGQLAAAAGQKNEYEALKHALARMRSKQDGSTAVEQQLQQEIGNLRQQLESQRADSHSREREVQDLKSELSRLQARINAITAALQNANRRANDATTHSAETEHQLAMTVLSLAGVEERLKSVLRELDDATKELAAERTKNGSVDRELQDANRARHELAEQLKDAEHALQRATSAKRDALERETKARTAMRELYAKHQNAGTNVPDAALVEELRQQKSNAVRLEDEQMAARMALQAAQGDVSTVNASLEEQNGRLQEALAAVAAAKEQNFVDADALKSAKRQAEVYRDKIAQLENMLERERAFALREIDELLQAQQHAAGSVQHTSAGDPARDDEVDRLRKTVSLLMEEIRRSRSQDVNEIAQSEAYEQLVRENKRLWAVAKKPTRMLHVPPPSPPRSPPAPQRAVQPAARTSAIVPIVRLRNAQVIPSHLSRLLNSPAVIDVYLSDKMLTVGSEGTEIYSWPYKHVKRYGLDKGVCSIEIGHASVYHGVLYLVADRESNQFFVEVRRRLRGDHLR
eukprot:m.687510 g.687510  ORF g.687510 m.687510 type:complete len:1609 (-) comp22843_c0_seq1:181-5007(-)